MKTTLALLAVLTSTGFGQIVQPGQRQSPDLVPLQMELSRLNQQLQIMQAQQAKPAQTYVAGETAAQRQARHAQVVADAAAAYQADWQAKNPLLSSMRAPAFPKVFADRAIAASDAQEAANAQYQAPAPDPQIAAMQKRIKALEAQVAAQQRKAKK